MYKEQETLIEGIGDELIYGLGGVCFVIPLVLLMFVWQRHSGGEVHPDSQEDVDGVRQRLRHQNRTNAHGSTPESDVGDTATQEPVPASTPVYNSESCPICLAEPKYAIETNCGHVFCGQCLITYWNMGRWTSTIKCPLCRQVVSIMLFKFSSEERRNYTPERQEVVNNVHLYNRRFSGEPRGWMEYLRDLPTLLRHCATEVFSLSGLVLMFRLRVVICFVFALLYFVSPLDIIPEAVFGIFGLLDDIFVIALLAIYVSIIYRQMVANRANNNE